MSRLEEVENLCTGGVSARPNREAQGGGGGVPLSFHHKIPQKANPNSTLVDNRRCCGCMEAP